MLSSSIDAFLETAPAAADGGGFERGWQIEFFVMPGSCLYA